MKKEIPISWDKFHQDVRYMSDKNRVTLTELYKSNSCSARQPRIYKALGWIVEGYTPKGWVYVGPAKALTDDMAAQIRAKSAELEKASDPLGLKSISKPSQKSQIEKPSIDNVTLDRYQSTQYAPVEYVKKYGWRGLADLTDEELVSELRRRGYEVTARKIVEL